MIGAGDATGGAIARRFAREGYIACVTRRETDKLQPLGRRRSTPRAARRIGFGSDARKEEEMIALVEQIEREIAPIEVAVFNIGANVRFPHPPRRPRASTSRSGRWPASRGFLMGREAAKAHGAARARHHPLHRRHRQPARRAGFAAFAGAKHALRALAQSMARELGPQGIHVAHHGDRRRDRHRVHPHHLPRAATR